MHSAFTYENKEEDQMDDGFVVIVVFGWIVGAFVAMAIASGRKVSVGLVFFLSLFFSPVVGVLVACLMTLRNEGSATPTKTAVPEEKCPKCAEMVKKEAIVCRFCSYDFGSDIAREQEEELAAGQAEKAAWEAAAPQRAAREKVERRRTVIGIVLLALIIVAATLFTAQKDSPKAAENSISPAPATSATASSCPWSVNSETNPVNGETTLYAESGYGKQVMVIRQTGAKIKLFINTDEFLETTDNVESRSVGITYRIDDGKPVHQHWTLSDNNTALFYPGDPAPLIEQLRSAKTFYFQYPPSGKVPAVITLDVERFPKEIGTRVDKTSRTKSHN